MDIRPGHFMKRKQDQARLVMTWILTMLNHLCYEPNPYFYIWPCVPNVLFQVK